MKECTGGTRDGESVVQGRSGTDKGREAATSVPVQQGPRRPRWGQHTGQLEGWQECRLQTVPTSVDSFHRTPK